MRKLLALTAALAIAAPINFAIPSAAAAGTGAGQTYSKFCQALADSVGYSQGNCLAYFNAGGVPNANGLCHFLEFTDPATFAATFHSFGACTAAFNALF
jgi:hypothetical protein